MRIGLLRDQQPFAEYINGSWRVWYIFNNDVSSGTYYDLRNDGICDRVEVRDRDVLSINRVSTPSVVETIEERSRIDQWMKGYEL